MDIIIPLLINKVASNFALQNTLMESTGLEHDSDVNFSSREIFQVENFVIPNLPKTTHSRTKDDIPLNAKLQILSF